LLSEAQDIAETFAKSVPTKIGISFEFHFLPVQELNRKKTDTRGVNHKVGAGWQMF